MANPKASNLQSQLGKLVGAHGSEERAKRMRVNAARASTTAKEILQLLDHQAPAAEKEFLVQVAKFFDDLNEIFEVNQRKSKVAKQTAENEFRKKREAQLQAAIKNTFGEPVDADQVRSIANALLVFASKSVGEQEAKRLGVDRFHFFVARDYELKSAIKKDDIDQMAREIAEVRIDGYDVGQHWKDKETSCYSAGWADFERFAKIKRVSLG
jgi:hypothetical protein